MSSAKCFSSGERNGGKRALYLLSNQSSALCACRTLSAFHIKKVQSCCDNCTKTHYFLNDEVSKLLFKVIVISTWKHVDTH